MPVEYANVAEFRKVPNPAKRPEDGYGNAIPTDWQVRLVGESTWRKVKAVCWSNLASFYVKIGTSTLYIRDSDFPTH